jgi:hypothetical protein
MDPMNGYGNWCSRLLSIAKAAVRAVLGGRPKNAPDQKEGPAAAGAWPEVSHDETRNWNHKGQQDDGNENRQNGLSNYGW